MNILSQSLLLQRDRSSFRELVEAPSAPLPLQSSQWVGEVSVIAKAGHGSTAEDTVNVSFWAVIFPAGWCFLP